MCPPARAWPGLARPGLTRSRLVWSESHRRPSRAGSGVGLLFAGRGHQGLTQTVVTADSWRDSWRVSWAPSA